MGILISEAAHCEHSGSLGYESNHVMGDQDGTEVRTIAYYNKPWTYAYRCKDKNMAKAIATRQMQAVANNNIGYSQPLRETYKAALLKVGYDPSKITEVVDCDCSSLTNTNVYVTLLSCGIKSNITGSECTSEMPTAYANCPYFENVTSKVNFETGEGLEVGDILFKPNSHTGVITSVDEKLSTSGQWVGEIYIDKLIPVYSDYEKESRCGYPSVAATNLVDVCDQKGPFYYCKIADKYYGYILKANVKKHEDTASTTTATATTTATTYTAKTGTVNTPLYLRSGSIGSDGLLSTGDAIATMPQNAKITILGECKTASGATWYKATYLNKTGYCAAKYVTV